MCVAHLFHQTFFLVLEWFVRVIFVFWILRILVFSSYCRVCLLEFVSWIWFCFACFLLQFRMYVGGGRRRVGDCGSDDGSGRGGSNGVAEFESRSRESVLASPKCQTHTHTFHSRTHTLIVQSGDTHKISISTNFLLIWVSPVQFVIKPMMKTIFYIWLHSNLDWLVYVRFVHNLQCKCFISQRLNCHDTCVCLVIFVF